MCFLETWERDDASTRNFLVKKYPCSKKHISQKDIYFLAFALVVAIARFLKRSTRPAVSIIFSLPV